MNNATKWVVSTYQHAAFPRIPKLSKYVTANLRYSTAQKLIGYAIKKYTTFAVALVVFRRLGHQLPNVIQLAQRTMTFLMQFNRIVSEAERKRKMVMILLSYLYWPRTINLRELLSITKPRERPLASLQTIVEGAVYQLCCCVGTTTATDSSKPSSTTEATLDIVLVHGHGQDAIRSWIGPNDKQADVWKAFAEQMRTLLCNSYESKKRRQQQQPRVRILMLRYDNNIVENQLNDAVEYLLLSLHYAQSSPSISSLSSSSSSSKTIFIAHGFGGNIVKEMLKSASRQPHKPYGGLPSNTIGVFFVGTIHSEMLPSSFDLTTYRTQLGGGYGKEDTSKRKSSTQQQQQQQQQQRVLLDWIRESNSSFFVTEGSGGESTPVHLWNNRILFYSVIPSSSSSMSSELQALCSVPEEPIVTSSSSSSSPVSSSSAQQITTSASPSPSPSCLYPHHVSSLPSNVNIKIAQTNNGSNKPQSMELWKFFSSPTTFTLQSVASFIEKSIERTDRIQYRSELWR